MLPKTGGPVQSGQRCGLTRCGGTSTERCDLPQSSRSGAFRTLQTEGPRKGQVERNRIKVTVEVDLDMLPGFGYDPDSWVNYIQSLLNQTVPHYHPKVTNEQEYQYRNLP